MGASNKTYLLPSTIDAIRLPSRIKCCRCGTVKNPEAFSKNKLLNLKQEIHRLNIKGRTLNPTLSGVVPCEDCTPKQKDEIQCAGCDKWKGRDAFSNQQRKNDDPLCWPCLHDKNNLEPFNGRSDDDDDDDDDDDSHGNTSDSNDFNSEDDDDDVDGVASTLAGTFTSLSVNNFSRGGYATASSSTNGGVPIGFYTSSRNGKENIKPQPYDHRSLYSTPSVAPSTKMNLTATESRFPKEKVMTHKPDLQIERERKEQQEAALQRAHDEIEVASSSSSDDGDDSDDE